MIKLGIAGFCGRMGQRVFNLARQDERFKIVLALERKAHPQIGKAIEGMRISDNPEDIEFCDCLVDFTLPGATLENLTYVVKYKKCAVVGTTGFSPEGFKQIEEAARYIPIVYSPNMSQGVNLLFKLIQICARVLKGYSVSLEEAHHLQKKDAPSGTAKKIAQILNQEGFNIRTEQIKAIREGEIVGDHRVVFESKAEKIELFHSAKTRDIFAQGALQAVKWVIDKQKGLYTMEEVLGLR